MSRSSSDIDGEEAERLRSVAVDSASVAGVAAALSTKIRRNNGKDNPDETAPSSLKFYQARARDLLYEYLDKTFDIKLVENEESNLSNAQFLGHAEDTGFHLFRRAPSGISDKRHWQVSTPKRKPPEHSLDESSEMFQASLLATAIDGTTVILQAKKAKAKAFASWVLQQTKEKETKREEEERVALLKVQRGERWLPSVAKDMRLDNACGSDFATKMVRKQERCKDLQRKDAKRKLKRKISKLGTTAS